MQNSLFSPCKDKRWLNIFEAYVWGEERNEAPTLCWSRFLSFLYSLGIEILFCGFVLALILDPSEFLLSNKVCTVYLIIYAVYCVAQRLHNNSDLCFILMHRSFVTYVSCLIKPWFPLGKFIQASHPFRDVEIPTNLLKMILCNSIKTALEQSPPTSFWIRLTVGKRRF